MYFMKFIVLKHVLSIEKSDLIQKMYYMKFKYMGL